MKHKTTLQMIKFTLFSISAGVIQLGTYAIFSELFRWGHWLAYLVSLILSILWNFTFNRRYTFQSAANVPKAMAKLFGFYAVFTPVSTWAGHLVVGLGINNYIVEIGTMLANFVLEFLYCKFVVYWKQENTRVKKEHEHEQTAI